MDYHTPATSHPAVGGVAHTGCALFACGRAGHMGLGDGLHVVHMQTCT